MKQIFLGRLPRTFNKWFGCRLYNDHLTYVDNVRGKKTFVYGKREFGPFETVMHIFPPQLFFLEEQPIYAAKQEDEWRVFMGSQIIGSSETSIDNLRLRGGRVHYTRVSQGRAYVALGNELFGPYDRTGYPHDLLPEGPQFWAKKGAEWFVVIGRTEIGPYEELYNGGSCDNADGKPLYTAKLQGSWYVFWGEERCGPFLKASEPQVHEGRLLFFALTDEGWRAYYGDRSYGPYQAVGHDLNVKGGEPYFAAKMEGRWSLLWGKRRFGSFEHNTPDWIVFVDDEDPLFCAGSSLWKGEREIIQYDFIHYARYSSDGVFLFAEHEGKGYVHWNLESYGPYDRVCQGTGDAPILQLIQGQQIDQPVIGKQICYLAKTKRKWHVMRGKEVLSSHDFKWTKNLSFADSKPLFIAGRKKGQEFIVWGDQTQGPFTEVISDPWIIQGKVAAVVRQEKQFFFIHGARSYGPYDKVFSADCEELKVTCGVLVGNMAYRLELE